MFSFKPRISKILSECFKRSTFIHNDKAAIMQYKDSLDYDAITSKLVAGVSSHADKRLVNQMDKYLVMLDTIFYTSEEEHNIYQQILYIRVISMFCVDQSRSAYTKQAK